MRLSKAIARSGVASRRKADELVREGQVTINGKIVTEPGIFLDPHENHIKVDGKLLRFPQQFTYLLMNKPKGVVTTLNDPKGRLTVKDLLKGVKERVVPVGRLDYNTEGLLLLSNDGELIHRLLHPRFGVERTYLVKVKGIPEEIDLERIRKGVRLERGVRAQARVKFYRLLKANAWLEVAIREGRNREVRRLCEAIGHPVLSLKRIRFGPLTIDGLSVGEYRPLTLREVRRLKRPGHGFPLRREDAHPEAKRESKSLDISIDCV
jgi:pseudouridine synthase